jgi:hypothetical protein
VKHSVTEPHRQKQRFEEQHLTLEMLVFLWSKVIETKNQEVFVSVKITHIAAREVELELMRAGRVVG